MAPPLRVTLDQAAHDELERRYHTTHDATTRTRYQMLLLRADGHRVPEVAQLTCCSPDTVRRVLKRYLAGGPDLDPHEVGVDSALWTCRLLADYLAEQTGHRAGIETVRVALHRAGFVCKRPRWVLSRKAQAQPGWAKNG